MDLFILSGTRWFLILWNIVCNANKIARHKVRSRFCTRLAVHNSQPWARDPCAVGDFHWTRARKPSSRCDYVRDQHPCRQLFRNCVHGLKRNGIATPQLIVIADNIIYHSVNVFTFLMSQSIFYICNRSLIGIVPSVIIIYFIPVTYSLNIFKGADKQRKSYNLKAANQKR